MDRIQQEGQWMKKRMPEIISIPIGLFHLNRGDRWGCMFVSDKCMEILECTMVDFLDRLMEIEVVSLTNIPEKTVGMLLEKMKITRESGAFVGMRKRSTGEVQCIRGNLSVSMSADGRLRVYGQITDCTSLYEEGQKVGKEENGVQENVAESLDEAEERLPEEVVKDKELREFLLVVARKYSAIVCFNLTKNTYHLLYPKVSGEEGKEEEGIEEFWKKRAEQIHPKDRAEILKKYSRKNLLRRYSEGRKKGGSVCRIGGTKGYIKARMKISFYQKEEEILAFLFLRKEKKKEK